jgi:hypothetical protein
MGALMPLAIALYVIGALAMLSMLWLDPPRSKANKLDIACCFLAAMIWPLLAIGAIIMTLIWGVGFEVVRMIRAAVRRRWPPRKQPQPIAGAASHIDNSHTC